MATLRESRPSSSDALARCAGAMGCRAALPIPVLAIGPGSQPPEDAELDVTALPHALNTFEMPPERMPRR